MPFFISFVVAGTVSGAIIAFALDMRSPKQLLQGALGGFITGLIIALLLPR
jgi:uncharacterized membrane protein